MAKTRVDWSAVEVDYSAGVLTLEEVAARHGISRFSLQRHARRYGWERAGMAERARRTKAGAAEARYRVGLRRLHRLVGRVAGELERRLDGEDAAASGPGERDSIAQLLNALTRAVAILNAAEERRMKEHNANMNAKEKGADVVWGADDAWAEVKRKLDRLAPEGRPDDLP